MILVEGGKSYCVDVSSRTTTGHRRAIVASYPDEVWFQRETYMRKIALSLAVIGTSLVPLLATAPAHAQATRTWVSGVGDDANPCSRTAPCKTFAGAISKTAGFGEINCVDPGGFGAVTITKSISIICDYTEAGVLVSGTNGIIVNLPLGTDR